MHLLERLQQNRVSGPVVAKQINQRKTFGRAILQMAHVHISPPSVEQKTAVACRLVPVPLMHIRQTETVLFKNPVSDAANGTGPFTLESWNVGTSISLTRFDGYWGEAPAIGGVEFVDGGRVVRVHAVVEFDE